MKCRNCDASLMWKFADLGYTPLANSYLSHAQLLEPEVTYPLAPFICDACRLVQLPEIVVPENIFREYAWYSGQSLTWVEHTRQYVHLMESGMSKDSRIIEIASNDGTLLKQFQLCGYLNVMGVEPAQNVARHAQNVGISTIEEFFTYDLALQLLIDGGPADLIVANNVLAHVPDLDDFVRGIGALIKPDGIVTFEFPWLVNLIEDNQFDQIYHEHYSYFTFTTMTDILRRRGITVFDVQSIDTHGGSLRVFAGTGQYKLSKGAQSLYAWEKRYGYTTGKSSTSLSRKYNDFKKKPIEFKHEWMNIILDIKKRGLSIAGYGAPAKGNTFLNYCGATPDLIDYVVDSTPTKQGRYLPGSHIPIISPEELHAKTKNPDVMLILPWNWREEIMPKIPKGCAIYSRLEYLGVST